MDIERLAVMFGGCSSYQSVARSTGGDALSRVELAGMLSGLREHERDYIYAYFLDADSRQRLIHYVFLQAFKLARREDWRSDNKGIIASMADIAVHEVLDSRCRKCKGTMFVGVRPCGYCHGSGVSRLRDGEVAARIGIDKSGYSRLWKRRYHCVFVLVQDIDCSVRSAIRLADKQNATLLA